MNNITHSIRQIGAYKGREGQWAWVLHRITGIGLFAFLTLHIFDIWLVGFGPEPFNSLALFYHHPLARIGHVFLFFCVLFHAVNGLRLIILDVWPRLWLHQRKSVWIATGIFFILFIPSALLILLDTYVQVRYP